jgi:capsular polysaccharide transport system permease protein
MKHQSSTSFLPASATEEVNGPKRALGEFLVRIPWVFVLVVVAPTTLAAIYFLLIASPLYVSEAQFVVHARDSSPASSLGSKLQSVGVSLGSESETDAYEVQQYMLSRDAVAAMERKVGLRHIMDRPGADILMRFPWPLQDPNFENLFQSYKRFVHVGLDDQTEISTLRVEAFRPDDARTLASALLDQSEVLINRLNDRMMADALRQATRQVEDATVQLEVVEGELNSFRNRESVIDPDKAAVVGLELLGKLETDLASLRAERAGLAASSPQSPQLPVLDRRIAAYAAQLEIERTRQVGEADSLAPKVGEYERLTLELKLDSEALEAAVAGLETARLDARRQQLFLERIVNPVAADHPIRPKRWLTVFMVLVSSLIAYAIVSLVIAGLREHRQI